MRRLQSLLPPSAAFPIAIIVNVLCAAVADAHVKWFCAYNVAGQPAGLENVLCPDFETLTGLSVLALMVGALVEHTDLGSAMVRAIDRVTRFVRDNTEIMYRAGTAFFFISIWAIGGILLTPELKTNSTAVAAIQLGIAAGMLSRRTMPLSAAGIAIIFCIAIHDYGIFHLADYPIFLGVAAYLALAGLQCDFFGFNRLDIVRWSAGVTLMWASIEKWAYPQWSYPLFIEHPNMTMGLTPDFFMRAAGAVEFALAFSLMWTPLVRRVGSTILAAMFISAVFEFGKVDLVGHTLIVVVLLSIAADNRTEPVKLRNQWLIPVAYAASLALFLVAYYEAHAVLFGTSLT